MNRPTSYYELLYATIFALDVDSFTFEELKDIYIREFKCYPKVMYKEQIYDELLKTLERNANKDNT